MVWWWTEKAGGTEGLLLVETTSAHSPLLVTVNSIAPPLCQTETRRDWITMERGEVSARLTTSVHTRAGAGAGAKTHTGQPGVKQAAQVQDSQAFVAKER